MEYSKPKENQNDLNKKLNISILQSQKLFNKNTAFVLSLNSPDKIERESCVDVLCVIDISGSMKGQKLSHVKLSLKSIISFMNPKDRLCIILFSDDAKIYLDLAFMTDETKKNYLEKIEKITAKGGTNILSGLQKAIQILKDDKKNENNNEPMEEKRVKTIMLLSDGYDNDYDTEEIVDEIKKITKGQHLSFSLHTFGYGDDFDSKLMSKLALIRDGSFFTIEDINKIQDYFVNALGGCMSTIYNEVKINVKMLKNDFKLNKIFGQDKLYQLELKNNDFSFGIMQLISGKEYTYTFEIELPEIVQINENIFEIEIIGDNTDKFIEMGKYKIVGGSFSIADEEYLKNKLYETLDEAMKLKEEKKTEQMNLKLNEMKSWIEKNYEGENKSQYLKKINEALGYMKDDNTFQRVGRTRITADIYENQLKRGGIYSNSLQMAMIKSQPYQKPK
jgi:Mg-chelatase subunit ChlD